MKEILISYSNNFVKKDGIETMQATNLRVVSYPRGCCITNGEYYMPENEKNLEWLGRILRAIYSFIVDPSENYMNIHLTDDSHVLIKRGKNEDTYRIVIIEKMV